MLNRCPAVETVRIEDEDLELQCVEWSADSDGRHAGDHHVDVSPAMGHVREWTNENLP